MFRNSETKKRGGLLPVVIFRLILSLSMFCLLVVGGYQAIKYFSGVDPLASSPGPQTELLKYINSQEILDQASKILGVDIRSKLPALDQLSQQLSDQPKEEVILPTSSAPVALRFAVVADSHSDNQVLKKALEMASDNGAKFVVGLGDFSKVGTKEELRAAKEVFESSGLPYYLTAGDHDLWDSRDKKMPAVTNFNEVFGPAYQSFIDSRTRFALVYNSDSYEGIDALQMGWIAESLNSPEDKLATFVFLHDPLTHPTSDRMMGKDNRSVKMQAESLTELFKEANVTAVFAGDIHSFTRYEDPGSGLQMVTAGALTTERNTQSPRFLIVDVLEDGNYNIEDKEVR